MPSDYDPLETRSTEARDAAIAENLPKLIATAQDLTGYRDSLGSVVAEAS